MNCRDLKMFVNFWISASKFKNFSWYRKVASLVYKHMKNFSDCLWRGFLIFMYCDLLTFDLLLVMCVTTRDFTILYYMVCYQPRPNPNSFLCILFEVWSLNHYSILFCKKFLAQKQIIIVKNGLFCVRHSAHSLLV